MKKSYLLVVLSAMGANVLAQVSMQFSYELERRTMPRDINVASEVNDMMADKIAQGYAKADVEKNREILTKAFTNMRNGSTHRGTVSLVFDQGKSLVLDAVGVAHDPRQVIDTYELFDGKNTWRDAVIEPAVLVVAGDKREHLCAFGDRKLLAHALGEETVKLPKEFANISGAVAYEYGAGGIEVLVPARSGKEDIEAFQKLGDTFKRVAQYRVTGTDGQTTGNDRRVITVTRLSSAGKPTVIEQFKLLKQEQMVIPDAPPKIKRGRSVLDARLGETRSDTYFWDGHLKSLNMIGADDKPSSDDTGVLSRAGIVMLGGVALIVVGVKTMRRRK